MSAQAVEVVNEAVEEAIQVRLPDPAAATREERDEMPLPTEPRTIFLGGLLLLAVLAALHIAASIVLPVILAIGSEAAAAAVRPADGSPRRAARCRRLARNAAAHCSSGRPGQWHRRPGGFVGGQAAGCDPAGAAATGLPGAADQYVPMDVRRAGKLHGGRDRCAAGACAIFHHCHGSIVHWHSDGYRRALHNACRAVLPAGGRRNLYAALRGNPAHFCREASGGGTHLDVERHIRPT